MPLAVAALAMLSPGPPPDLSTPIFLPDDPLHVDPDRLDMPPVTAFEVSEYYTFLINAFGRTGRFDEPSLNVNTLGEVPASSWYEPRHYSVPMSLGALRRGPERHGPPVRYVPWRVVEVKEEGDTPGMHIIDGRGKRYMLKFDPKDYPELTTGAEVVATRFFYALGYHVPENHLVRFRRQHLVPAPESTVTPAAIDAVLALVPRSPDGTYRAMASLFLEGEPLGPFLFHGTRPDDANDIFPHEARRELRGLRVFAAWLQHVDARSTNTLAMQVEEAGRTFVRHHLLDFGSTLGASPHGPLPPWSGHAYVHQYARRVRHARAGSATGDALPRAVGRIGADGFDPEAWRPQYPNPAFQRMDAHDAFWAARQVAHFSDAAIRAIVSTGQYSDPKAVDALTAALVRRRDAIASAYLDLGGGLDRFRARHDTLVYQDLLIHHELRPRPPHRTYTWRTFDNQTARLGDVLATGRVDDGRIPLPASQAAFTSLRILTPGLGVTRVYLRRGPGGHRVVGLERCREDRPCARLPERIARIDGLWKE